jgi:hypothetical protein
MKKKFIGSGNYQRYSSSRMEGKEEGRNERRNFPVMLSVEGEI